MADGGNTVEYENDWAKATLSTSDWSVREASPKHPFEGEMSLADAAEMYVILAGAAKTLSFLPFVAVERDGVA